MVSDILDNLIGFRFMHLKFIRIHPVLLHQLHKRIDRKCVMLHGYAEIFFTFGCDIKSIFAASFSEFCPTTAIAYFNWTNIIFYSPVDHINIVC